MDNIYVQQNQFLNLSNCALAEISHAQDLQKDQSPESIAQIHKTDGAYQLPLYIFNDISEK